MQMPTLDEFVARASDFGCKRVVFPGTLTGPEGEVYPKCMVGPRGITTVLPDIPGNERLTPTVLNQCCRALGIPPEVCCAPNSRH